MLNFHDKSELSRKTRLIRSLSRQLLGGAASYSSSSTHISMVLVDGATMKVQSLPRESTPSRAFVRMSSAGSS
jgi:hypothetical protein